MKIRGYIKVRQSEHNVLTSWPFPIEKYSKDYTFEIDVPPFALELKVDPSTIKEVTNNVEGTSDDALTPGDQSS